MKDYLFFDGELLGGKATQLVKLKDEGFNVPAFKVVPAEIYKKKYPKLASPIDIDEIFTPEEQEGIINHLPGDNSLFSVRSSAVGEDGKSFSYAGQFESYLYVRKSEILDKIIQVWNSAHSERIAFYRQQNNITEDIYMAVIVQEMIDADISGVMFGVNPISLVEDEMLISAVYGIGEGLVSGELDADNYYFKNGSLSHREIAEKNQLLGISNKKCGTELKEVEKELQNKPALDEKMLTTCFEELIKLNEFYDFPQDVEFALKNNELHILQSRPITNYKPKEGTRIVWDNSNIVESYPGVTTPLTFSFIREMYKVVYIQFCELLGVGPKTLAKNEAVFENMLGLLKGRVYYNLLSWYQALALLPGYHINARFMETMMGVNERFDLKNEEKPNKISARLQVISTIINAVYSFFRLPKKRKQFFRFVENVFAEYKKIDFNKESPEQLMHHYNRFEKVLTEKWDPPLVNDFFAMIYFGIFQKTTDKWLRSNNQHLHNDLLTHSEDILSVAPMIKSLEITKMILEDKEIKSLFEGSPNKIWSVLSAKSNHPIYLEILKYIDLYGDRTTGELKLETITYKQDPIRFIKILKSYTSNPTSLEAMDNNNRSKLRKEAEEEMERTFKGSWFKKILYRHILRKTRELVSNRENLRFERTRGFGIVRQIFIGMGVQFTEKDFIDHPRDIFFLTKEEIFDFIKGTSHMEDLREPIELRKREFETYENANLAERITTYGTVYDQLFEVKEQLELIDGDLKGIACCPGQVEAEVCVIHSPDEVESLNGRIMVTTSTDPGWVSLFPTASAILVERGSLLSHSAIVARELGIPCIVGVKGLLKQLNSGDRVLMDGSSGIIKRL